MPEQLVQMNLSIGQDLSNEVDALVREHGWTKRHTITLAVRTLKALMDSQGAFAAQLEADKTIALAVGALEALMDAHKRYAAEHDEDIGELYMRLAAEMPAGFVEVPKDGVRVGRAAGMPAVMIDGAWLVWADPDTGNLFAEEQGGDRRVGIVVDGEIKSLKVPRPEEVALN